MYGKGYESILSIREEDFTPKEPIGEELADMETMNQEDKEELFDMHERALKLLRDNKTLRSATKEHLTEATLNRILEPFEEGDEPDVKFVIKKDPKGGAIAVEYIEDGGIVFERSTEFTDIPSGERLLTVVYTETDTYTGAVLRIQTRMELSRNFDGDLSDEGFMEYMGVSVGDIDRYPEIFEQGAPLVDALASFRKTDAPMNLHVDIHAPTPYSSLNATAVVDGVPCKAHYLTSKKILEVTQKPSPQKKIKDSRAGQITDKIARLADRYGPKYISVTRAFEERMPYNLRKLGYKVGMGSRVRAARVITARAMQEKLPKGVEFRPNPEKKSFISILERGLEDFKKEHPEIELHYDADSKGVLEVSDILDAFLKEGTQKQLDKYLEGEKTTIQAAMEKRLGDISPEHRIRLEKAATSGIPGIEADKKVLKDLDIELDVEKPFTIDRYFIKALELADGDINEALIATASKLKQLTRAMSWQNVEQHMMCNTLCAAWVDEFSDFVPWNELPAEEPLLEAKPNPQKGQAEDKEEQNVTEGGYQKDPKKNLDFSRPNQVGKPYHAFHLASLLDHFSPEVLSYFVAGEYAQFASEQGWSKGLYDLRVLSELYDVRELLESYSS